MKYNIDAVDKHLETLLAKERSSVQESLNYSILEGSNIIELIHDSIVHCKTQISKIRIQLEKQQDEVICKRLRRQLQCFENNLMIWNLCGHLQNVSVDIKNIQTRLYADELPLIRRKSIGEACKIVYESSKVLIDNTGAELRHYIQSQNTELVNGFLDEFNMHRKKLTTFRETYSAKLKNVRVGINAHYDNDIIKQLDIIKNLSWSDTIETLIEYEKIILGFGPLFSRLIQVGLQDMACVFVPDDI